MHIKLEERQGLHYPAAYAAVGGWEIALGYLGE